MKFYRNHTSITRDCKKSHENFIRDEAYKNYEGFNYKMFTLL